MTRAFVLTPSIIAAIGLGVAVAGAQGQFNPNQGPVAVPAPPPGGSMTAPGISVMPRNTPAVTIENQKKKKSPPAAGAATKKSGTQTTAVPGAGGGKNIKGRTGPGVTAGAKLKIPEGVEAAIIASGGNPAAWREWQKFRDLAEKGDASRFGDQTQFPWNAGHTGAEPRSELDKRFLPKRIGKDDDRKPGEGIGIHGYGPGGAPGGVSDPSGQVSQDKGGKRKGRGGSRGGGWELADGDDRNGTYVNRRTGEMKKRETGFGLSATITIGRDRNGPTRRAVYVQNTRDDRGRPTKTWTRVTTRTIIEDGEERIERVVEKWEVDARGRQVGKRTRERTVTDPPAEDSMPSEAQTARVNPRVRCDFWGCIDLGFQDRRQTNPGPQGPEGGTATSTGLGPSTAPGPGAATDPVEEGTGGSSGGGGVPRNPGGEDPCFGKGPGCGVESGSPPPPHR
jgi:hypothetical protein